MEQIIITHPDGTTLPLISKAAGRAVTKAEQSVALLGEDTVKITVQSAEPLDFTLGDIIDVYGKAYKLNQLPEPTKNGERNFSYELTMEGAQYDLIDVQWLLPDNTVLDSFTGDLEDFLDILVSNLNRVYTAKWQKGTFPADTEFKTLAYTEKNVLEVAQDLCKQYGVEFEIGYVAATGKYSFSFKSSVGSVFPYTFRYGRGGGLYQLQRKNISSKSLVTRLYAYGGSSNIPSTYRHSRLCLPGKAKNASYIETAAAVELYGVRENTKVFNDIFPNRYGQVTGAGSKYYGFIDGTMDFDLNAKDAQGNTLYLIPGVNAKVKFTTGNLGGYEFDVHSYDHTTKEIQLVPFTDENGMKFPSETSEAFQPGIGDKYFFVDINLPDSYKEAAESKLQTEAEAYVALACQPQVSYNLKIAEGFLSRYEAEGGGINVFAAGDSIPVEDTDLGLNRAIRIQSFSRDLLKCYAYDLKLADETTATPLTRIISDLQDVQDVIEINQLADPSRARRNWKAAQEVLASVFDPDGHYFSEKIRPASVETTMLAVGAKSQQLTLVNARFEPNYNGNPNNLYASGGTLIHYAIEDTIKSWTMQSGTLSAAQTGTPYYLYAECDKTGGNGRYLLSTEQRTVESVSGKYTFLIGTLSSVITDDDGVSRPARILSLTFGSTTINGRFIKTGRIESSGGGTCYFDLDNGEIGGVIKFRSSDGTYKNVVDTDASALEAKNYIDNTLPGIIAGIQEQLDGQIEQFFETYDPTTSNQPAASWTTTAKKEEHLGDLFYNTSTGKVFRWVKEAGAYKWQELQDSEVAQALALANDALDLARTKRRIFTAQPTTPYEVGDLWVQGASGDIMSCKTSRASGAFTSSDWVKSSKYTDNSALIAFINDTYTVQIEDLVEQLDGKIESFFTTSDPASSWTTAAEKAKHVGDFWYNDTAHLLKRYALISGVYQWVTIQDDKAIAAYEAAGRAQDTADGKRRVFVSQPVPPYDVGDLWLTGGSTDGELKRCVTAKASGGSFAASDWQVAVKYDNTQTIIDGGIVTSGTVQLAGSAGTILAGITGEGTTSSSVRLWAGATKANRASAPFRVLQDGSIVATKAKITGEINATSGTFKNIKVEGSLRSPFKQPTDSFDEDISDNVALLSEGGGWMYAYGLPWTTANSGRKICITNYRWRSSYAEGTAAISAPSGKYFYENGISTSELKLSREVVELLGYGDENTFYGWIVLNRKNLMTNYRYGREARCLLMGRITITGNSVQFNKIVCYDGTRATSGTSFTTKDGTVSMWRGAEGRCYLIIPSAWFSNMEDILVQATGYGWVSGSTSSPCKATATPTSKTSIRFDVSDDAGNNDGSFMFAIYNMNDWKY